MTHADLVSAAIRWLRGTRRCTVVLSEWAPLTVNEIPDAIGFSGRGVSTLVECKVSRSDFRRDADKVCARRGLRMGRSRWYLTPPGLVTVDELPERWGLAELRGQRVYIRREAGDFAAEADRQSEIALLAAACWRHENGVQWFPSTGRFAPVPR